MADSSYEGEVKTLQKLLNMQHLDVSRTINPSDVNIQADDFIAPRFFKKIKAKSVKKYFTILSIYLSLCVCVCV